MQTFWTGNKHTWYKYIFKLKQTWHRFIFASWHGRNNTTPVRLHRAILFVNMKFLLLTAVLKKLSNNEQFLCVIAYKQDLVYLTGH